MRRLTLLNPLDEGGERFFTVGENCDQLLELPSGGYTIVRGKRQDTVPAARVDHFTDLQRPGLTPEPPPKAERNGLSPVPPKLPRGVRSTNDAARPYACEACSWPGSSTLHGAKTHYAKVHADG